MSPGHSGGPARALPALLDCARALLAGGRWALPATVSADDFEAAVHRHRVDGFLRLHRDRLTLPEDLHERLDERAQQLRDASFVITAELVRAHGVLAEAGIDALFFKGPALALLAYGDPLARGAGDIDLLVDPTDVARACTVLGEAGWRLDHRFPEPGASWAWRHLVRNGYEVPLSCANSTIDLHWWLDPTTGALPGFAEVWPRRVVLDLAGHAVPTLAPRDTLLHSCSHASKDDWGLVRSLIDIRTLTDDPAVLSAGDPLAPVHRLSLAVVDDLIGLLPPARAVLAAQGVPRRRPAFLRRARRALARPLEPDRPSRIPGGGWASALRRTLRGSKSPRDVRRILATLALAPASLHDVDETSALTAIPHALQRRAARAVEIARGG